MGIYREGGREASHRECCASLAARVSRIRMKIRNASTLPPPPFIRPHIRPSTRGNLAESPARNLVAVNFFPNTGDTFPTTPSCVVASGVCVYSLRVLPSLCLLPSRILLDFSFPFFPPSVRLTRRRGRTHPRVSKDI